MKIDIEQFECRAFLGSPEVLAQPQIIPIIAVIMEWTFAEGGADNPKCTKEQVTQLAKHFLESEYTPFRVFGGISPFNGFPQLSKLDISNFGVDWNCNVVWLSNYVVTDVSSVVNILAFDSI
jgi:hypothetical protein